MTRSFLNCTRHQMKVYEMGGTLAPMGEMINSYKILIGELERKPCYVGPRVADGGKSSGYGG
jgi:hypothetical protein